MGRNKSESTKDISAESLLKWWKRTSTTIINAKVIYEKG
jgi:hypothetical protein